MTCEEAKMRLQALVDNELDDTDIEETVSHIESCAGCRAEYVELLKLQRKMKGVSYPEPSPEWFEEMERKIPRRVSSVLGTALFFGSYAVLLAYALFSFFTDAGAGLLLRLGVGGVVCGLFVLFGITLTDRIRESRTDRYKGVVK